MDEKLARVIRFCFKLLHGDISDEMVHRLIQFIKFGIVGVSSTAVSYAINVFVLLFLDPYAFKWDYIAGNITAFLLSVLWSFFWNSRVVFTVDENSRTSTWKTLARTYLVYGFTGIILNNIISWFGIHVLGISKYIMPFTNIIIGFPINFILNKVWAFQETDKDEKVEKRIERKAPKKGGKPENAMGNEKNIG